MNSRYRKAYAAGFAEGQKKARGMMATNLTISRFDGIERLWFYRGHKDGKESRDRAA